MKKLLVYMKGYGGAIVLSPLLKLIEAALELFVPLVIARVVDRGVAGGDRGYITGMCLLLGALGVIGYIFSIIAQYFAAKVAVGFVARVKHVLFAHLGRLSYTEMDTLGSATMITRMTSDMNQMQSGINLALRLLLRSPFVVFGAMVMAFTVDVKAALTFAVAIPVLCIVVFGIMLVSIPLYKKVQAKLDAVLKATRENLSGVRVIRAFCHEKEETEDFHNKNEALTREQKFVGRISALMNPITYIIINLATVWLIHIGAIRVEMGILTSGAVIALYNYMSQILIELIKMANLFITITKAIASGNRVQAILEIPAGMDTPAGISDAVQNGDAVRFDNVTLTYRGAGAPSLETITFSAARGETVGIIGGTGSGKTSLVNMIPRFYDATEGSVTVNGIDVRAFDTEVLREKIGIVPQKALLFRGTIRENLLYGNPDATDDALWAALEIAQARSVVEEKPGGLDFQIEAGGRNLSGGQRQRLTIARALVRNPEILILDDSASALDFATDAALRKALKALPSDMTVFIVSQRTSSIAHADKILVMEDGCISHIGTHAELLETSDIYREIYDSQFKKEAAVG
ncbi:MAG: ABC transporter ATP-binding protein [Clostridia bacterium]|nr:ABC transporter ATP-binding protein [Clostridia bacterium]